MMSKKLKVLLSAYACEPNKGSEPGVGWNWLIEIAKLNHKVTVITRSNNKKSIINAVNYKKEYFRNINFIFCDLPNIFLLLKKKSNLVQPYYFIWQIKAFLVARRLCKQERFDFVHHITFVSIRSFSLMWLLGIPYIFGPIAGGEKPPLLLSLKTGFFGFIKDALREFLIIFSYIDPLFKLNLQNSHTIIVATKDTLKLIPRKFLPKTKCISQIGINPSNLKQKYSFKRHKKLLFVGRFIYCKGMKIGFEAFKKALKKDKNLSLTMVGEGPELKYWQKHAENLGIHSKIKWKGWVKHYDLEEIYNNYGVLLFPSLHDSAGQVILEAMSYGLPVCCLNIGGPGNIVNNINGISVEVKNMPYESILNSLADSINKITKSKKDWLEFSNNAYKSACGSSWEDIVKSTNIY